MHKIGSHSFALLCALFVTGSALAQSGVDASRVERRCPSSTLSSDPAAACSDDVLNDRPRAGPGYAPGGAYNPGMQTGTGTTDAAGQPLPGVSTTPPAGISSTPPAGVSSTPAAGTSPTPPAGIANTPAAGRTSTPPAGFTNARPVGKGGR